MDIHLTLNNIGDFGNATDNRSYSVSFLYRILLRFFQQHSCLVLYKILCLTNEILADGFLSFPLGKTIRIFSIGKSTYFHMHILFQNKVDSPKRRPNPCGITIKENHHIFCQSTNQSNLFWCEGCSRRGDYISDPRLMHLYDIGVSLNDIATVFFSNTFFGFKKPIKHFAFMIDITFGRVEIFSCFYIFLKNTPSKTLHSSRKRSDGENNPSSETINFLFSFLINDNQSCLL